MTPRRLLSCLLLGIAMPASSLALTLDGPPELVELLRPHLPENASPRRLESLSAEILGTEGYFSPALSFSESTNGLQLRIDPGERTRVESAHIAVDGPLAPETRERLIAGWQLPVGQPFRQADWNQAKQQILSELIAEEHADARLLDSRAEIDPTRHSAALTAHYDAGPRYRFGPLQVEGLYRYSPALVERYNRSVKAGDPYRADDLTALVNSLQSSPHFASVRAELATDEAIADEEGQLTAPVRLRVRERPAHRLGFGAGASSNTGARVEANYNTPNLFNQAWTLDTGLRLEQKRQTAYADIFLPPDRAFRRHSIGVMVDASNIEDLRTQRKGLGVQSIQQRGSIEQRLSLNWQDERREADGALPVTSRALVPNVTWTWRSVDDLLAPRHGSVVQLSVGGATRALLSDQDFVRLHARWHQYIPLGRRDTLMLRAELGHTLADDEQRIPQDYLFRTGGSGSVRGYDYQSIGLSEGRATVGGRSLAVLSAEATHWLSAQWGIAAFIDAGDAVDTLRSLRPALGYGLGVRWQSPAGPIGADLAYGERSGRVKLHFSLAIPF